MNNDTVADRGHAAVGIPEYTRLRVAADFHAWDLTQRVAGNGRNLPRYQRRRAARGIDIDDADLAGIEPTTLDESRPLLELSRTGCNGNGLALKVLRRLDVGVGEDDDRSRIATIQSGDCHDTHAFRDTVPHDIAVREAKLRRLAGDELSGVSGPLAGANLDVEAGLFVKAFVLCHHEAGIRPLVDPIKTDSDLPLGLRVSHVHERYSSETRGDAATEKLSPGGRSIVWHHWKVS